MKTILIDLDGVLNEYTGDYKSDYIPPIKLGAYEFLKNMSCKYKFKIFTTRDKKLAEQWTIENNISSFITGITNEKVPAWLIIDDRCLKFDGNFETLSKEIEKFRPWYK